MTLGEPDVARGRAPAVAVTVLGGYLGSGKTTLVNRILTEATERIAVLVNDFGSVNIDADLIESRGEDTLTLANGCICCSLVDGFAAALDTITALDPRPDRLVIEASGVSDPAQVAAYGHGPGLVLDAVIVLADAEQVRRQVDDNYVGQTVRQQLQAAHVIVLNKADLIAPAKLEATESWLRGSFPDAVHVTTTNSVLAPEILFGGGGEPVRVLSAGLDKHDAEADNNADNHVDHQHDHASPFRSWTIDRAEPMTRSDVDALMRDLPDSVVRAKGFVLLDDSPDVPGVLQRVGRRWTVRKMGRFPGEPKTQIVVIEVATTAAE